MRARTHKHTHARSRTKNTRAQTKTAQKCGLVSVCLRTTYVHRRFAILCQACLSCFVSVVVCLSSGFGPLPPRKGPWRFLAATRKHTPLPSPWWIGESVLDGRGLPKKSAARTYPGLVSAGLMNPPRLILASSLSNRLSLDALVLDSMSRAQSFILDVWILVLCNGPQF